VFSQPPTLLKAAASANPHRLSLNVSADANGIRFPSSGATNPGRASYTPSPGKELLRTELASAEARRKRRSGISGDGTLRSGEASAKRRRTTREQSPDKVYVMTSIPPSPRLARAGSGASASASASPFPPTQKQRDKSPPLSNRERIDKINQGREVVQRVREQYRAKIGMLGEKYGVGPAELGGIVTGLAKSGGGAYWDDVEKGLEALFGF
jgi:hypothetical protein